MTNPFKDSRDFMNAIDQSTTGRHRGQFELYLTLIREEVQELEDAVEADDNIEVLDALMDILVVTLGAANSIGADSEGAWNEVMRTNFAKVDPETGKVRRRADGKVLKPPNWAPPDLKPYIGQ